MDMLLLGIRQEVKIFIEEDMPEYCIYCGNKLIKLEKWIYYCPKCKVKYEVHMRINKGDIRMAGIGEIHFKLADEAMEHLKKMGRKYFKARHLFEIMKDELPNQDIRDISKILHILKQRGVIRKWKRRTWEIVKL